MLRCLMLCSVVFPELHIIKLHLCQLGSTQQLQGQIFSELAPTQAQLLELR